jgi:pyrimidine operon attenuation protein/uracil phosphoribosyltransferase
VKKTKSEKNDWIRPEYKREDLSTIVRGKYAKRIAAGSNVVVIDPVVAKAFPNEASVNAALRGLIDMLRPAHVNLLQIEPVRKPRVQVNN